MPHVVAVRFAAQDRTYDLTVQADSGTELPTPVSCVAPQDCPDGTAPTPAGCQCPSGTFYDPDLGECVPYSTEPPYTFIELTWAADVDLDLMATRIASQMPPVTAQFCTSDSCDWRTCTGQQGLLDWDGTGDASGGDPLLHGDDDGSTGLETMSIAERIHSTIYVIGVHYRTGSLPSDQAVEANVRLHSQNFNTGPFDHPITLRRGEVKSTVELVYYDNNGANRSIDFSQPYPLACSAKP